MAWKLAKSLDVLRSQVNALYPNRSKASDGTIGDTSHAARPSDHNPDKDGIVKAFDLTHDPAHGVNGAELAPLLAKDPRTNYVIYDRKLYQNGKISPYTGTNPHTKHIHTSVKDSVKNQSQKWNLTKGEDMTSRRTAIWLTRTLQHKETPTPATIKAWTGLDDKALGDKLEGVYNATWFKNQTAAIQSGGGTETGKVEAIWSKVKSAFGRDKE